MTSINKAAPKFDNSDLKDADEALERINYLKNKIQPLLVRVKNGYFSSVDVVLKSGLSREEVEKILKAQEKGKLAEKILQQKELSYKTKVGNGFADQREKIENDLKKVKGQLKDITISTDLRTKLAKQSETLKSQLKSLKIQQQDAESKFPNWGSVISGGAETLFKKALLKMPEN
jgi:hypothetical protein